jgi:hypothetical protein
MMQKHISINPDEGSVPKKFSAYGICVVRKCAM